MLPALLSESFEIGDHTDTDGLEFEGQSFKVKNCSATKRPEQCLLGNTGPVSEETQLFPHGPVLTQELGMFSGLYHLAPQDTRLIKPIRLLSGPFSP